MNPPAEAAIRASNDILAADNLGVAQDPVRDERRVLDEVGDLPPIWWTPMLGFRAVRKVSDEHNAPGISGGLQTRSG